MNIRRFINKEFPIIEAYAGTDTAKENLARHAALVVQDEDLSLLGILTPLDIVQRPHNLVIDCLTAKAKLTLEHNIDEALQMMRETQADALPVYHEGKFEGLVLKNDLIDYVTKQKRDLENKVIERTAQITDINNALEASKRVLKALFDSTQSDIFLVSPSHRILFFNKRAYENGKSFYKKELKVGDSLMDYAGNTSHRIFKDFKEDFEKALQGKEVLVEKEVICAEEIPCWFRLEYFPVYEEEKLIGVAIMVTDINESKKHELHIEEQNKVLKRICWIQSHETRQPLASILGLLSIVDKSELSKENHEVFEMLERSAKKLDEVIRNTVVKANAILLNNPGGAEGL